MTGATFLALDADTSPATTETREARIAAVIEKLRPVLRADGGDVEFVAAKDNKVFVHMTGACVGCQLAYLTLGGVQVRLYEELGERLRVIPVTPRNPVGED